MIPQFGCTYGNEKLAFRPNVDLALNVHNFISERPIATIDCSSPVKIGEGRNFTCECRGEGGNPSANVTWYKDGKQISETRYETNTLNLTDVNEKDSGTYKCVVQSYTLKDESSIDVIARYSKYVVKRT